MATVGPAEAYRPPVSPFAGWTRDDRGRLVPLESAPHVGGFAPPGTGKTRRWLAQSAVLWPGPALVSSSKDDLMQMVASRRAGPIALLDLRPITAPFYPNDFVAYRFDPTALITGLDEAKATAQSLLSTSAVALSGSAFRSGPDPGPWDQLAFAPLTCLLFAASPAATGLGMDWALEASENLDAPPLHGRYQMSTERSRRNPKAPGRLHPSRLWRGSRSRCRCASRRLDLLRPCGWPAISPTTAPFKIDCRRFSLGQRDSHGRKQRGVVGLTPPPTQEPGRCLGVSGRGSGRIEYPATLVRGCSRDEHSPMSRVFLTHGAAQAVHALRSGRPSAPGGRVKGSCLVREGVPTDRRHAALKQRRTHRLLGHRR